jgi:hypothetical protein
MENCSANWKLIERILLIENNPTMNISTQRFRRFSILTLGLLLLNASWLIAQPDFVSAKTTSLTTVEVTFTTTITSIVDGTKFVSPGGAITISGTSLVGGKVILTVSTLSGNDFTCTTCLTVQAGAVSDGVQNANLNNKNITDGIVPGAPALPTSSAGAQISAAENGNFNITVTGLNTNVTTGDILEIFVDGVSFGTPLTKVLTAGEVAAGYTFTNVTLPGLDGAKAITAKLKDANNNLSAASPALNLTLDTALPAAPTALDLAQADDSGLLDTDNITSQTTLLTISGSAEAGSTVELFRAGSVSLGTTTATGGGTFSLDVSLTGGGATGTIHAVTAKSTDAAGNVSVASTGLNVTVDTSAPTAPGTPSNTGGTVINASENGTITISVASIAGSAAVAGDRLEIYQGGVAFSPVFQDVLDGADIAGTVAFNSVTLSGIDGAKVITARVTDIAGNLGAASGNLNLTLDTTAPTVTALDLAAADDAGLLATDNITNLTSNLTISGTTEAGAGVEVFRAGAVSLGTTTADGAGAWSLDIALTAAGNTGTLHNVTAKATDTNGNLGVASASLDITVDNVAPVATGTPTNTLGATINASENGTFSVLVGTIAGSNAVAGDRLEILIGGASFSSPRTDILDAGEIAAGVTFTNVTLPAPDGAKVITAVVTDVAGNSGTASAALNLTLDASVPAAPTGLDLATADDTGLSTSDNITTNDGNLTIQGAAASAEAGSTVSVYGTGAVLLGSTTAAGDGSWTFEIPGTLTSAGVTGTTHPITATATDAAGNTSVLSTTLNITIDKSSPTAPGTPTNSGGSGISSAENGTFTVTVSSLNLTAAVAGDQLEIFVNGGSFAAPRTHILTAGEITGGYTFTNVILPAPDGAKVITAKVKDVAGNESSASGNLNLDLDTSTPSAPPTPSTGVGTYANASENGNFSITVGTMALTGAVAGDVLELFVDGVSFSPAVSTVLTGGIGGTITLGHTFTNITLPAPDGAKTITAKITDAAGNASVASAGLAITRDVTVPASPTVVLASSSDSGTSNSDRITNLTSVTITGTSEGSATIQVYVGGIANAATVSATAGGAWSRSGVTLADGGTTGTVNAVTATATDAAGNTSTASAATNVTVDTSAPTISGNPQIFYGASNGTDSGTGNKEVVQFQINEPISLASGASVTYVGTQGVKVMDTGANSDDTAIGNAYYYDNGTYTRTVRIISSADNSKWNHISTTSPTRPITQLSYVANGNLQDIAGNIFTMSATNVTTGDAIKPTVSPATYTLYPRAGNPEKIVFTMSEALNFDVSVAPFYADLIGFQTSTGSIATARYTESGGQFIVTLTSAATGNWTSLTTVSYVPSGTSNVYDQGGNELAAIAPTVVTVENTPPSISSVTIPNATMKVGDVVTVTINTTDDDGDDPIIVAGSTVAGRALTLTNGAGLAKTATFTIVEGSGDIAAGSTIATNVTLRDLQNNTSTAYTTAITQGSDLIDATSPTVSYINRVSSTTAWSTTTFGTTATSVNFEIDFSENIDATTLTSADFSIPVTGSVSGASITNIAAVDGDTYTVTVGNYSGTGTLGLNYVDNEDLNEVKDVNGNYLRSSGSTDGDFTGQTYSIVLPQPTNHVDGISSVAGPTSTSQITVNWTLDAIGPNFPTHLLIVATGPNASEVTPAAFVPSDGTVVTAEEVFTDGTGIAIIDLVANPTASSYTFSNLRSGRLYTFDIYPYSLSANNANDNVDYKKDATIPTTSLTTGTAAFGTITAGSTAAPTTISSLSTTFGSKNFTFKFSDDAFGGGANLAADDASTRFNQLIIRAGTGNSVSNWADVIAEAELRTVTETTTITTTTIGTNTITFTMDPADNKEGEVDDNEVKEYELRIRLRSPLLNGAANTVDNNTFVFQVLPAAVGSGGSFAFMAGSSGFEGTQTLSSGGSNNIVRVNATGLAFTTQPLPTTHLVDQPFTTSPVVKALDANGNLDLDFNGLSAATITNVGSLPMTGLNSGKLDAVLGVVTFPAGFMYNDDGNGTLRVDGTYTQPLVGSVTLFSYTGTAGAVACNAITVQYTNTTTLSAGSISNTGVSSIANTSATAVEVFDFFVREDNGVSVGTDGSPTLISGITFNQGTSTGSPIANWLDAIQGAVLMDESNNSYTLDRSTSPGAFSSTSIIFSGIPTTSGSLGYVTDNSITKRYRLAIYLKATQTTPTTIDGKNFVFSVANTDASISVTTASSTFGTYSRNSGGTNNAVAVKATKLTFLQDFTTPTVLALKNISPALNIEAVDANGNRDVNFTTGTNTVSISNPSLIQMTINGGGAAHPLTTSATAGVITISNFQYLTLGNGTLSVSTTTLNADAAALAPATSATVTVVAGQSTTVVLGAASPATISSLADQSTAPTTVFNFNVTDDNSVDPNQNDGLATFINKIVINANSVAGNSNTVTDWSKVIHSAELFDGTNTLSVTNTSITAGSITFSPPVTGIPRASTQLGYVADGTTKNYQLKIYLFETFPDTTVQKTLDNKMFQFSVASADIFTDANSTAIASGQSAISTPSNNKVVVVATKLHFTSSPTTASISTPFDAIVEARDVNGNRDTDYTGAITSITVNGGSFALSSQPANPFEAGVLDTSDDSPLVQNPYTFSSGDGATFITVNSAAQAPAGALTGSRSVSVTTAYDSWLYFDNYFGYSTNIGFVSLQKTTPLTNDNTTSAPLGRLILSDGGYGSGVDYTGSHDDIDGATTAISSVTLSVTHYEDIRLIALFDVNGNIIPGTQQKPASASVTFSGLSSYVATDGSYYPFTIRASFEQNVTADHDQITMKVTSVTHSGGSKFPEQHPTTPTMTIGGVSTGSASPGSVNILDVVATRLDFTTQPPGFAGINEPLPLGTEPVVSARDIYSNLDLDFNYDASFLNSDATPDLTVYSTTASFPFVQGILTLTNLRYNTIGDGTLIAFANGIKSTDNSSIQCSTVHVLHVTAASALNGLNSASKLIGGAKEVPVFGVTFNRGSYAASNQPKLEEFTVTFKNHTLEEPIWNTIDITKTLIYESVDNTFAKTDIKLTGTGAVTVTYPTYNTMRVQLTTPKDLSLTAQRSYFVVIDVVPTVKATTPKLQGQVLRYAYSPDATAGNIVVQQGSSFADVTGKEYSFIDITPPAISVSNPANGQTNFEISGQNITITFNEDVHSLLGKISLYERISGVKVGDLDVTCGAAPCFGSLAPYAPTLTFITPVLTANTAYYINIPGSDIYDAAGNAFAGISDKTSLSFKTANLTAPTFSGTPSVTNISLHGADIVAQMDQIGKVYWLLVSNNATAPTAAQVVDPTTYGGEIQSGVFDILNPLIDHFGSISDVSLSTSAYDIYLVGENDARLTPIQMAAPTLVEFTASTPAGTGLIITGPEAVTICDGTSQLITEPISITERNNNDFSSGSSLVDMNFAAPNGFLYETSILPTVNLYGNDFTGLPVVTFINNTIFKLQFINNGSSDFDRITITGIELKPTSTTASGAITRLGGTALTTGIPDGTKFGEPNGIAAFVAEPIEFTNDQNLTIIGNDVEKVTFTSQLSETNPDFGPDVYSGKGVIDGAMYPEISGIGTFDITLTHTYQNGCVSTKTNLYTIYNAANAIPDLKSKYCSDTTKQVINGNKAPSPGLYLRQLEAYIRTSEVQIMDSLTYNDDTPDNVTTFNLPLQSLVKSDTIKDATIGTYWFNYEFDPQVFDPESVLIRQAIRDLNNGVDQGGFAGNLTFKATYYNIGNEQIIELLQTVQINIPPKASFTVSEIAPADDNVFCESFGNLNLTFDGTPSVTAGQHTGVYKVNGSTTFAGLEDLTTGKATLNTQDAGVAAAFGDLAITYTYTSLLTGCTHTSSTPIVEGITYPTIRISADPTATFQEDPNDPACNAQDELVTFDGTASSTGTSVGIREYHWNFDDPTFSTSGNPNTTITLQASPIASHHYEVADDYDVTLQVISDDGCISNTETVQVPVGAIPTVDFTFSGMSVADGITFDPSGSSVSVNDSFDSLVWNFADGKFAGRDFDTDTVRHYYSTQNIYNVNLTVTSGIGCENSIQKTIIVLPHQIVTFDDPYYETFTGTNAGWQTFAMPGSVAATSWGVENDRWTTGAGSTRYNSQETSVLYGPVFDISGLQRPILTFDALLNMAQQDGLVVQFSTDSLNVADPDKKWFTLGKTTSGSDWFNGINLLSNPGDQTEFDYGFTHEGLVDNIQISKTAKHSLSQTESLRSIFGENQVVLRFAFASIKPVPETKGFTLDNVRIGEGTRTILVENFSNTAADGIKTANDFFRDFVDGSLGDQIVKIDYHTSFPGSDPFNQDNQADHGSRALFYNVSQVPYTVLDGQTFYTENETTFSDWAPTRFSKRILDLATAKITGSATVIDEQLVISGDILPLEEYSGATYLHVAVIEKQITVSENEVLADGRITTGEQEFKYVLRKLLPNANGKRFEQGTLSTTTPTPYSYIMTDFELYNEGGDLQVVVFLQDEDTKVIHQAYLIGDITEPTNSVVGINDPEFAISLYPNPADKDFTIQLSKPVKANTPLLMYDQLGHVVKETVFEKGESSKVVNTSTLAAGVYLIKVDTPEGSVIKKLMVVHNN